MQFKDDRLFTDPELIELRTKFHQLGEIFPGWNWDEYNNFDDYKEKLRQKLKKLQEKAGADK